VSSAARDLHLEFTFGVFSFIAGGMWGLAGSRATACAVKDARWVMARSAKLQVLGLVARGTWPSPSRTYCAVFAVRLQLVGCAEDSGDRPSDIGVTRVWDPGDGHIRETRPARDPRRHGGHKIRNLVPKGLVRASGCRSIIVGEPISNQVRCAPIP
jgi:hypothetical protein